MMVKREPTDRPAGCQAQPLELAGFIGCEKCGLAWRAGDAEPACQPMTVGRIRSALNREIAQWRGSAAGVLDLAARGVAADPIPALTRAMELAAVREVTHRCLTEPRILDILNPKRAAMRREADESPPPDETMPE